MDSDNNLLSIFKLLQFNENFLYMPISFAHQVIIDSIMKPISVYIGLLLSTIILGKLGHFLKLEKLTSGEGWPMVRIYKVISVIV